MTPHTLRHTAATLVEDAGTSLKTTQALLGHATERMTLQVYSHRTASSLEAVALTLEHVLGDLPVAQPTNDLTASKTTGDTSGDQPGDQTVTDTA